MCVERILKSKQAHNSVEYNNTIDFVLFTDNEMNCDIPKNMFW